MYLDNADKAKYGTLLTGLITQLGWLLRSVIMVTKPKTVIYGFGRP
jgi:hypothetical protein